MKLRVYKKKVNRETGIVLTVFFLALLPRLIMVINAYPVLLPGDEVCTFGYAAYAAGYDWKEIMSSYSYYGFGYSTVFLTPLYWLFDNPVIIYKCALLIGAILQTAIFFPCYFVMRNIFYISDIKFNLVVSVGASYMTIKLCTGISNEYVLALGAWGVLILIFKFIEDLSGRQRTLYTISAVLLCSYMYTVHIRGIVYIFLFFAICLFYTIFLKKKTLPIVTFLISSIILLGVAAIVIHNMQVRLSNPASGNTGLTATLVYTRERYHVKDNFFGILNNFIIFLNNIHFFSAGISIIAIAVFVDAAGRVLIKRNFSVNKYFICAAYAGIGILGFALAISYHYMGLMQGMPLTGIPMENTSDSYLKVKGTMMIRYGTQFYSIMFMTVMAYLYQYKNRCKKIIMAGVAMLIGFVLWEMRFFMPAVQNMTSPFMYLGIYAGVFFNDSKVNVNSWLLALHIFIVVFTMLLLLLRKKKVLLFAAMAAVIIISQYFHLLPWHQFSYSTTMRTNYESVKNGCGLIRDMQKEGLIDKERFLIGVDETNNEDSVSTKFIYQFMLYDFKITQDISSSDRMPEFIFSKVNDNEKLLNGGYMLFQLNDKEYVYLAPDSEHMQYVRDYAGEIDTGDENVEN